MIFLVILIHCEKLYFLTYAWNHHLKVCLTKKVQFIIKNLTTVYIYQGQKWRDDGAKKGELWSVLCCPTFTFWQLLFKHMKRFSKPVYRPTEFLFPTIKVSSDQRKKKSTKQTNKQWGPFYKHRIKLTENPIQLKRNSVLDPQWPLSSSSSSSLPSLSTTSFTTNLPFLLPSFLLKY